LKKENHNSIAIPLLVRGCFPEGYIGYDFCYTSDSYIFTNEVYLSLTDVAQKDFVFIELIPLPRLSNKSVERHSSVAFVGAMSDSGESLYGSTIKIPCSRYARSMNLCVYYVRGYEFRRERA